MMTSRSLFVLIAILMAGNGISVPAAHAQQMENENILVGLPAGYKIGFQARKGNATISEMVPTQETVENWSEMITVQIFHGSKNLTPQAFRTTMQSQ